MKKSKRKPAPRGSLARVIRFFETHDMGEYWESLPEAHFEVSLKRRTHLVPLEEELIQRVRALAKRKKVTTEALISGWLEEKLAATGR